ncbi:hypothetical protein [Marinobacter salarius]|uniref:pectate lyase family protein n=1 Tax=Marinobacter salarius TaxID=1420917 RepID=UPI003D9C3810
MCRVLTTGLPTSAGDSRPGEIQIDDQPVALLPFGPTGGWDRWQVVSTSVYLTKGENRVRLTGTGADGGTTGGEGGREVTASTLKDFTRFAGSNDAYIIRVQGIIPLSDMVSVGSNTTVVGVGDNSGFTGGGLQLKRVRNVIIRNLKLSFSRDDLIQIYDAHNIWINHNELWNDRNHHKDYYDGLVDITRGSDYVTVSWNRLRDLFRDWLKTQPLAESEDTDLRLRAARWLQDEGYSYEAFEQWIALLEGFILFQRGELINAAQALREAELCFKHQRHWALGGETLFAGEELLTDSVRAEFPLHLASLRAHIARLEGDIQTAIELSEGLQKAVQFSDSPLLDWTLAGWCRRSFIRGNARKPWRGSTVRRPPSALAGEPMCGRPTCPTNEL